MAGIKKSVRAVTLGRNKEIRVRYVRPETFKALADCGRLLNEKTVPDTVVKLIHNYPGDQQLIKQLQARNNQLNAALLERVKERAATVKLLQDFVKAEEKNRVKAIAQANKLIKKLTGKGGAKRRSSTR